MSNSKVITSTIMILVLLTLQTACRKSSSGGATAQSTTRSLSFIAANGDIYIADSGNHKVKRIDSATNTVTTVYGTGTPGTSADGTLATDALTSKPSSIALASNGDIYVAEYGNYCVRKISSEDSKVYTVLGTCGTSGAPVMGSATSSPIFQPGHMFLDETNSKLYVPVPSRSGVLIVDLIDSSVSKLAGTESISGIYSVAKANNGTIYYATWDNLMKLDDTNQAVTVAGTNPGGIPTIGLGSIGAIYPHSDGNIYFGQAWIGAVRRYNPRTNTLDVIAGDASLRGDTVDGELATATLLRNPETIAMGFDDNLLIIDGQQNLLLNLHSDGRIYIMSGSNSDSTTDNAEGEITSDARYLNPAQPINNYD